MPGRPASDNLPAGTVTFLFTDIEGSTRLLAELGAEAYAEALAEHRERLRSAFDAHGGVEVDTQGDAFFVAFADATAAVSAARDAHAALSDGRIRVRIGLHTGHPHVTEEGYVGHDVHLGARIAAAAHGGQVLLSRATSDSLERDHHDVLDLGEHRVKDFPEPVWIYQLGTDRFPPLRTISNTNLPRPASSFVGREREVGEVGILLRESARFVTLTGPGGTGKTRLAIEAASELVPDFRNGTFWVDLAPMHDETLVTPTIAQTVGAKDGLVDHIGEREMLLVLDNLEQVVGVAPELARLVSACPNLRLLTTSRERLRVRDEVEYAVPPLAAPEAVELFSARSGLSSNDTIAALCRRLDSLPLAIELAAARTSVLSPAQIMERLGTRLDLLKGGRDAEARQATLRATIEWSYELLTADEQTLFARLAVFAGGFVLEAAEAIADAEIETLQALVDKSLLRHEGERFSMLETIRDFATERLLSRGDAGEIRRVHALFFARLAARAESEGPVRADLELLDRLEDEIGNLRAAIDWLLGAGETQLALGMTGSLWSFWNWRGHIVEGLARIMAALEADDRPTRERGKALNAASELSGWTGQHDLGKRLASEALALHRSLGDAAAEAWSIWTLGLSTAEEGDFESARDLLERSVTAFGVAGGVDGRLAAMRSLAWVYEELGDHERALALCESGLSEARAAGKDDHEATFLGVLGTGRAEAGHIGEALAMLERAIELDRMVGDRLALMVDMTRTARVLAIAGTSAAATRVLARADALREEMGLAFEPWNVTLNERTLATIRTSLSDSEVDNEWAAGRALTDEAAVALGVTAVDGALEQRGGR